MLSGQIQDELQTLVDRAHVIQTKVRYVLAEVACIHCADHLAEDPCGLVDVDLRMEARSGRRSRGRTDHDRRQRQEVVRLNHHRVSSAMLHTSTPPRKGYGVDVTTNHASP